MAARRGMCLIKGDRITASATQRCPTIQRPCTYAGWFVLAVKMKVCTSVSGNVPLPHDGGWLPPGWEILK